MLITAYTLQMMAGNEVYYIYPAQTGDPDYIQFMDRIQNKPGNARPINDFAIKVLIFPHF